MNADERNATAQLEELLSALSADRRGAAFAALLDLIDSARNDVLPDPEVAVEDWRQREGL